jgi:hypothetical protein
MAENTQTHGPSTARIEAVIYILTFLINLGKYLRWIELAFGIINTIYAVLNFFVWNQYVAGTINLLFAIGSFIFFAQLVPRARRQDENYQQAGLDSESTNSDSSSDKTQSSVA